MESLKGVILDQREEHAQPGVTRRLEWKEIPRKAFVCTGVRRCGKSTLLHQIRARLLAREKQDPRGVFHLNFFDDRFQPLKRMGFSPLMDALLELYPEAPERKFRLFLDEIQEIPGWEPFVERLLREGHRVFITGSSAKLLSAELATQMRGRALNWELFPFDFREYLDYRGIPDSDSTSARKAALRNAFGRYASSGGFPETLGVPPPLRVKIHQEYLHAMLHRDVIERHDVAHPRAALDLAYRLLSQYGSLYSVNRLTEYLRSLGHKTDKNFVSSCLDWFEDCYFLFSVKIHDRSLARQNVNAKKIYAVDHAFPSSISPIWGGDAGARLENMVFISLRRKGLKPHYYRTKSGKEVDFLVQDARGGKHLIQACHAWPSPETWQRETSALEEAMHELRLKSGTIVTTQDVPSASLPENKRIRVIPAWRFLLDT